MASRHIEAFEAVDRTEGVLHGIATAIDFIAKVTAITDQTMGGSRQTMTVDLIAVSQARLHHAISSLDLLQQPVHIGREVFVNLSDVRGDHRREQHTADARCWLDGQDEMTESQPPRR
jgi:hypothetical protein